MLYNTAGAYIMKDENMIIQNPLLPNILQIMHVRLHTCDTQTYTSTSLQYVLFHILLYYSFFFQNFSNFAY